MIAEKTKSEIQAMSLWARCRWYKTISPKEKEEAMQMMENIRRINLSAAHKGKILSEEHKVNLSKAWTLERKTEMSMDRMGKNNPNFGKSPSEETRAKLSKSKMGKIKSEETKNRMSIAITERWKSLKYRNSRSGENHHNWKGGLSFEPYGIEFNEELKEQIRQRDNYICQECDKTQEELECKLSIHHIDYDKTNNKPENLISLCKVCHGKTNFDRNDWIRYFRKIMNRM